MNIDTQIDFLLAIFSLLGITLGISTNLWFMLLNIFVGIVLLISALNGRDSLRAVFQKLPWNK